MWVSFIYEMAISNLGTMSHWKFATAMPRTPVPSRRQGPMLPSLSRPYSIFIFAKSTFISPFWVDKWHNSTEQTSLNQKEHVWAAAIGRTNGDSRVLASSCGLSFSISCLCFCEVALFSGSSMWDGSGSPGGLTLHSMAFDPKQNHPLRIHRAILWKASDWLSSGHMPILLTNHHG